MKPETCKHAMDKRAYCAECDKQAKADAKRETRHYVTIEYGPGEPIALPFPIRVF